MQIIEILENLEILFGFGCLGYAIYKARREIYATWKRHQQKGIVFTPAEAKKTSISRFFDLTFVLFSSALFSLLLVASCIQKTDISGPELLGWASLITVATTGVILAMWYVGKAELGIGAGGIFTLSWLFIQPEGQSYLWLSLPILVFIAATMWIYELGNPLEKTTRQENKFISAIIILTILVFPIIDLGFQYHYSLLQDKLTPKRFYVENNYEVKINEDTASFINANFNQNTKFSQNENNKKIKILYAALSDIQLGDSFYRKNHSFVHQKYSDYTDKEIQVKNRFLQSIFADFQRMTKQEKVKFLSRRLRWIYPVSEDNNIISIPLPGIQVSERFENLANTRTCNALLQLQTEDANQLLNRFDYTQAATPKKLYKSRRSILETTELLPNFSNGEDCVHEKEFIKINSKDDSLLLLKQLALPAEEEAYLAFKEYYTLAQDILRVKDRDGSYSSNIVENFFAGELEQDTQNAFLEYFTGNDGWNNYKAFKKLIEYRGQKVTFISDDKKPDTLKKLEEILSENRSQSPPYCQPKTSPSTQTTPANSEESASPLTQNKGVVSFLSQIHSCLGDTDIEKIKNLVNKPNLYDLFDEKVVKGWLKVDEDKQKELFKNLRNPLRQVFIDSEVISYLRQEISGVKKASETESMQRIIQEFYPDQDDLQDTNNSSSKVKNDDEHREEILHDMAYSLYGSADTSFQSPLNRIVIVGTFINLHLGRFVALLFQLPFPLIAVVLAQYAAQTLVTRDRLGTILLSEKSRQVKSRYTMGKTDTVRGRDSTVSEMKKRAGRGWSSIAIVGRRGVGKTRILYELIQPDESNLYPKGITAWVSAPTKFDESEFVESVLESLTADIEYTVAEKLGAKPLEIRRIETNQTIAGIVIYSLCLVAFISVALAIFPPDQGVAPEQAAFTLLPVGCFIACSIACLILHYISLQPVNLSSWLERDRVSNPQTALLYRDMRRVCAFLEQRRIFSGSTGKQESINYPRLVLTTVLISTLVSTLASFIIIGIPFVIWFVYTNFSKINQFQLLVIIGITILLIIAAGLALRREVSRIGGYSLMSLVAEYREFCERTVYRIHQGALGERPEEDFEIIVCIDELDKIVDEAELRNFIRRIKVIFEIPGVYYYLSLSEDALKAFYLGTAEGKNEVDSAFDHIIYVPPLDCDLGEKIAKTYLEKHSKESRRLGVERAIAAASYGVPRDILRRCDELVARGNIKDISPSEVCDSLRKRLAELAYGDDILTKQETLKFTDNDVYIVFEEVEFFLKRDFNLKAFRVVLAIWLLALLALATESIGEQWQQTSEDLRQIGYRIADENPQNLIEELKKIQEIIVSV
ncbi:hypothetical protein H6G64_09965 [Calothrix sp. FACHB-156]|nr:hypothetical protein [Calothrix sp. FACHB-156]